MTCVCRRNMWKSEWLRHYKCSAGHIVSFDELIRREQFPEFEGKRWRNFCRALRQSWRSA